MNRGYNAALVGKVAGSRGTIELWHLLTLDSFRGREQGYSRTVRGDNGRIGVRTGGFCERGRERGEQSTCLNSWCRNVAGDGRSPGTKV